uniref:Retrovirus-related Pol polyprotein from transposon TNT 1-94 n=1 Tax=Tanacetum cinerariifolium TaxID=118510 RepID=A0A6L2P9A5_TANCI|nr:retrovirus-related Pol polyprotein from transposon TNT 1-94 [Tanacetum cinerariifolium]
MILESVENGPLLWPTVEENGVTRSKKYSELSTIEAIQVDCDVKAKNIILQGLPPEVYALVSTHKVAKEIWERIQMLMQGTSLTKQKRECKLYEEFDKFAYKKGESLRDFYLRFSLLLNDMNIYNMKLEQFQVVQFVLWNDHVAKIMGYGDYKIGNVTISRVYFVKGLGHNLFSMGQFCDLDLEAAFRQHTYFIRNLDGVDLLTGSRGKYLYTLSLQDMMTSSPICLFSKAPKTKSWLWHCRLSHMNFGAINHLDRQGLVRGLPRLKFEKDHLCSACAMGKSKKKSHKPKSKDTNQEKLYLLHMDCGSMHVEIVNRKKIKGGNGSISGEISYKLLRRPLIAIVPGSNTSFSSPSSNKYSE